MIEKTVFRDDLRCFSVCIHRGARQIGGTCIELACEGQRILLDLGMPLDAGDDDPTSLLPEIDGLKLADPSLLALIVSHGHADHWGLAAHVSHLPIITGAATRRMLRAAAPFVPRPIPDGIDVPGVPDLVDRKTIHVGPFSITPYLVDHSAYDAYAMLIEANGRRLFYSGDLRGHGRKAALFERLVEKPPQPIHAMMMEGSSLGRLKPDQAFETESQIEDRLLEHFQQPGFIGINASAQNVDRVVSIYRACKRTGRTLLLDLYALEVLAATDNQNIPREEWPNIKVYVPEYQRLQIVKNQRFDIVDRHRVNRIYREALQNKIGESVMLFRPAMVRDIDLIPGAWAGARVIWSQWDGYLRTEDIQPFLAKLAERGVPLEVVHTSGHASIIDLKRLAAAMAPDVLVPVHTFEGDRYSELFGGNVIRRADGEWWEV
ncbi:MAG: MBL fold metallo-hydrolase [Acidocella sp. 20-58-15]|nr:MAG: MBL fold metallo-hydrolase [Acidocella sp. 20-58-15]